MANIKNICVRFNLDKPLHKKAHDYLKSQSEFSSNSQAVITAVADYFDNRELVDRIVSAVEKCVSGLSSLPIATATKSEEVISEEIDFDFLGS